MLVSAENNATPYKYFLTCLLEGEHNESDFEAMVKD